MKLMKPEPDMIEGTQAFTRFENTMKKVLSVPKAEVQRRIEEHRKEAELNPNKRGPKPKRNGASRAPRV
jgi:hypothetical protein